MNNIQWCQTCKKIIEDCGCEAKDAVYVDEDPRGRELDRYPELKAWLEKHDAKMMWTQKMNVAKMGPVQQDCWLIGNGYAMIFFWPTSYGLYTAAPGTAPESPLADAEARLLPDDGETCTECRTPYTKKDIDYGRCLTCGTMICARSPTG